MAPCRHVCIFSTKAKLHGDAFMNVAYVNLFTRLLCYVMKLWIYPIALSIAVIQCLYINVSDIIAISHPHDPGVSLHYEPADDVQI